MLPDIREDVGTSSVRLVTDAPEDGVGSQPDATQPPDAVIAARFRMLFDAEYRSVLQYCLRRVEEPEDAADVLAETFLVAWRRFDDVPEGEDARFWLYGVARRVLANVRRGARRRDRLTERLRYQLATDVQGHLPTIVGLRAQAAFAQLDDDDRELLTLIAWEGLSSAEVSKVLGVSAGATRVRVHRARARLRRELRSEEGRTA